MLNALGLGSLVQRQKFSATGKCGGISYTNTHARGDGVLFSDREKERLDSLIAQAKARAEARARRHRQPCGAKTRKGHACRLMSEPGKRRCKFHGGKSTGPKTREGKDRIAAAQRRRWSRQKFVEIAVGEVGKEKTDYIPTELR